MPKTDKFQGILTDRELGIIEDALECYIENLDFDHEERRSEECKKLIKKLYKFWEVK